MRTLGSDVSMPPGGWKLTVPETGQTLHAPYANSLFRRVNDHLRANSFPEMGRAEFEDAVCRESNHGAPWCNGAPADILPPTTLHRVKRFLRTMATLVRHRQFVSKAEHSRRMEICKTCPSNSIEGLGCHGCFEDLREVERHVGPMPDGNVLLCRSCGCICWAKAWLPNEVMDKAEENDRPAYAEGHCWRLGH